MTTIVTEKKKKNSYFRDVVTELKKVNWTSKEELFFGAKVVIIGTFLFAFAIYGVDLIIRTLFNGVSAVFQMIFG